MPNMLDGVEVAAGTFERENEEVSLFGTCSSFGRCRGLGSASSRLRETAAFSIGDGRGESLFSRFAGLFMACNDRTVGLDA